MSREYNYPTEDELQELISNFCFENNLDATWLHSSEGYLAIGISYRTEDEES